jgi:hypothetical protein
MAGYSRYSEDEPFMKNTGEETEAIRMLLNQYEESNLALLGMTRGVILQALRVDSTA